MDGQDKVGLRWKVTMEVAVERHQAVGQFTESDVTEPRVLLDFGEVRARSSSSPARQLLQFSNSVKRQVDSTLRGSIDGGIDDIHLPA
jgi:hypothetical protein